jgi:hypothetical protein
MILMWLLNHLCLKSIALHIRHIKHVVGLLINAEIFSWRSLLPMMNLNSSIFTEVELLSSHTFALEMTLANIVIPWDELAELISNIFVFIDIQL